MSKPEREQNYNRDEAEVLIAYTKSINKENILISALDAILNNQLPDSIKGWSWGIADIIEGRTNYIIVEKDADVDFDTGDWGMPIITGGFEKSIGITINDKDNLMILRQEVDDIINKTNDKINRFIKNSKKPKWKCKNCGRFLGKDLLSVEEIKKLLRDFSIGKYWKCRSCKLPNYFTFNAKKIEFKIKKG